MPTNPLSLWADLWGAALGTAANSVRLGETMLASATVIDHRTRRLAAAGGDLKESDLREIGRMVTEKQEAFHAASTAAAGDLARLSADLTRMWLEVGRLATGAPLTAAAGAAMAARQTRILGSTVASADKMLRPYHQRSTANARRLARRKKN